MADTASLICKIFRLPLISVLHGGNLPKFAAKHPKWIKRVLKRSAFIVSPSNFLAKEFKVLGFRIQVIPNVIQLNGYLHRVRRKVAPKLLWMRSFHSIYNPQMAVKVLYELQRDYPDATLVMAGPDKGLEGEIKQMVSDMELSDYVRFPGFLDPSAKVKEFSEADIYINTTKIDNMPVSVVEAGAMGVPVVATNVGGISHLIDDGKNGLLVPDDDVQGMVIAVKKLLNDPELTQKISVNGRSLAESSSWANVLPLWEDLFVKLRETKTGGGNHNH